MFEQYIRFVMPFLSAQSLEFAFYGLLLAYLIKRGTYLRSPLNIFTGVAGLAVYGYLYYQKLPLYLLFNVFLLYGYTYKVMDILTQKFICKVDLEKRELSMFPIIVYHNSKGRQCVALQDVWSSIRRVLMGVHVPIDVVQGSLNSNFSYVDAQKGRVSDLVVVLDYEVGSLEPEDVPQSEDSNSNIRNVMNSLRTRFIGLPTVFLITPVDVHKFSPFDFLQRSKIFEDMNNDLTSLSDEYHKLQASKILAINRETGNRVKSLMGELDEIMLGFRVDKEIQKEQANAERPSLGDEDTKQQEVNDNAAADDGTKAQER